MRRFSSIDIWALLLAALFFIVGGVLAVHPTQTAWMHPTTDPASITPTSYPEVISKKGARAYGVLGMVLGVGLAVFVIFPKPSKR